MPSVSTRISLYIIYYIHCFLYLVDKTFRCIINPSHNTVLCKTFMCIVSLLVAVEQELKFDWF